MEAAGAELITATENLQIVLDTVPGVREAFGLDEALETSQEWVEAYGADQDTIDATMEGMTCINNAKALGATVMTLAAAYLATA